MRAPTNVPLRQRSPSSRMRTRNRPHRTIPLPASAHAPCRTRSTHGRAAPFLHPLQTQPGLTCPNAPYSSFPRYRLDDMPLWRNW